MTLLIFILVCVVFYLLVLILSIKKELQDLKNQVDNEFTAINKTINLIFKIINR